jgi:hypothetical protein
MIVRSYCVIAVKIANPPNSATVPTSKILTDFPRRRSRTMSSAESAAAAISANKKSPNRISTANRMNGPKLRRMFMGQPEPRAAPL